MRPKQQSGYAGPTRRTLVTAGSAAVVCPEPCLLVLQVVPWPPPFRCAVCHCHRDVHLHPALGQPGGASRGPPLWKWVLLPGFASPQVSVCLSHAPAVFQVKQSLPSGSGQPVWYSPGAEGLESIHPHSSFPNPQEGSDIRAWGPHSGPRVWSQMGAAWGTRQSSLGTGPW